MRLWLLLTVSTAMAAPAVQWSNIALSFEPNTGQAPAGVAYIARGSHYTFYLAGSESVLAAPGQPPLRTHLLQANPGARIEAEKLQPSITNYFSGNDPAQWRAAVPNYAVVRYTDIYPGIDLVYYGKDGQLEYDWLVSPGADPGAIRMAFEGGNGLRIDRDGDLVMQIGGSEIRHKKPVVYQDLAGVRAPVAGAWTLAGNQAGFRLGAYDRNRPLIIDPPLIYSSYLGGNNLDSAYAVAVDAAGNTYVAGSAGSANFPATNPLQGSLKGAVDAFVTKISPDGSSRIYSTYLGGGGPDQANGIAVDLQGNAYIVGNAGSPDFPLKNALQPVYGGSGDAFVAKINPSGSALVYSTYLGGNAIDNGTGIALDSAGNVYVVGATFSTNFPTVSPFQAAKGAQQDAFVAKINPAGTAWVYTTYLGGNDVDEGYAIAADAAGNAYVTGYTASTNFPLQTPFRGSNVASVDAFVTKLNPAGSALVYSTYLGGSATDYGTGIAVDSAGSAYVTGIVESTDFPVVAPMQAKLGGGDDAFVTKFDPSGRALTYSTYLGGGSTDDAYAIAIDQAGNAYITGRTNSSDFPLTNAIQSTRFAFDLFVTELSPSGAAKLFSTFIGGSGSESGQGIAVDRVNNIHIAGQTTSTDFPVRNAMQNNNGGGAAPQDAVVILLGDNPLPDQLTISISHSGSFNQGQQGVYNIAVSNAGAVPSIGTITVSPSLAAGETLVSMTGAGWTCSGLTCTRADTVPPGSSFPPITMVVTVAATAPATVTNTITLFESSYAIAAASDVAGILTANGHPLFFSGENPASSGFYSLQLSSNIPFGSYAFLGAGIFYHVDMGYEAYVPGAGSDIYLHDFASGHWLYTDSARFPQIYDFSLGSFIEYLPDSNNPGHYTSNPRVFLNLSNGMLFHM